MLDPTRLRVLVAVARHGSVTAAAQELNYAQPSISHHMARLEAETGAKLMERSGRGIRLTEAGRLLAERAEEILGRLDAAEAELAAHVGLRQERVRLAACGSALATIGAAAAAAMLAEHPGLDIRLAEAEHTDALHMLKAGVVDVALVCRFTRDGRWPDPEAPGRDDIPGHGGDGGLRWRLVLDEPIYLIAPTARGMAEQPSEPKPAALRLADCASMNWIAGGGQEGDFLERLCRSAGFIPDIAARTADRGATQALVAAGVGVAILPGLDLCPAMNPDVAATELTGVRRHILAVTYGDPPDPPATTQLVEELTRAGDEVPLAT